MSAPDITIYTRHSAGCKYAADEAHKRCACRKWLRWTLKGKRYRQQAGTRSWADAELKKREIEDQLAGRAVVVEETTRSLRDGIDTFLTEKRVQGIEEDGLARYTRELTRLALFCEKHGVHTVQGLARDLLTKFCGTWLETYPSSQTRSIVRARLRAFLRYCYESQWLVRIPPLPKMTVDEEPTMPLTPDEFAALMAAADSITDPVRRARGRSLFLLMRWSGLAIGDALRLRRKDIIQSGGLYRIVTARQKTGTDVSVPIPPTVAAEILATPNSTWTLTNGHKCHGHPDYIFWDGKSQVIVRTFLLRVVSPAFKASGIEKRGFTTSHRLRDTFAVDLLEKGVPLEEVSKLLGHESIKTTERHYSKWVQGRQDRLDALVTGTWA